MTEIIITQSQPVEVPADSKTVKVSAQFGPATLLSRVRKWLLKALNLSRAQRT
jgi:hypothetical protein